MPLAALVNGELEQARVDDPDRFEGLAVETEGDLALSVHRRVGAAALVVHLQSAVGVADRPRFLGGPTREDLRGGWDDIRTGGVCRTDRLDEGAPVARCAGVREHLPDGLLGGCVIALA